MVLVGMEYMEPTSPSEHHKHPLPHTAYCRRLEFRGPAAPVPGQGDGLH